MNPLAQNPEAIFILNHGRLRFPEFSPTENSWIRFEIRLIPTLISLTWTKSWIMGSQYQLKTLSG